jgi:hypothetical protein
VHSTIGRMRSWVPQALPSSLVPANLKGAALVALEKDERATREAACVDLLRCFSYSAAFSELISSASPHDAIKMQVESASTGASDCAIL